MIYSLIKLISWLLKMVSESICRHVPSFDWWIKFKLPPSFFLPNKFVATICKPWLVLPFLLLFVNWLVQGFSFSFLRDSLCFIIFFDSFSFPYFFLLTFCFLELWNVFPQFYSLFYISTIENGIILRFIKISIPIPNC